MDNLNKQQVILLALLVAFATSISTGIVVASILDTGSDSVTQTIYRVVEKTIQEVAPESSVAKKIVEKANNTNNSSQPTTSTQTPQEKPLILSDVAEKAGDSIFKIYDYISSGNLSEMVSVGLRFNTGMEVIGITPSADVYQGKRYFLVAIDGTMIKAKISKIGKNGYSVFTIDEGQEVKVSVLKSSGIADQRIGSSVVAFGTKSESNVVSTGIVSSIEAIGQSSKVDDEGKDFVVTDIKPTTRFSGFILLSTSGEVVGLISTPKDGDNGARYIDPKFLKSEFPSAF